MLEKKGRIWKKIEEEIVKEIKGKKGVIYLSNEGNLGK